MIETGYFQVFMALILAILALILIKIKSIPVVKESTLGVIRSFIQLIAVGYILEFIFGSKSFWPAALSVLVMLIVAAYTSSKRAEHFKSGFKIAFISLSVGSLLTLGIMLALKIITMEARYIIPLTGMIISNSMNASSIAFNRIGSDLKNNKLAVETALSLGKTWREASRKYYRDAVKAGMISIINFMETVGIVALPGAMTGMILAGASPLKAVLIQIVVAYMLLASVTITSLMSAQMSIRTFFNDAEQFIG
jgi:putative ABC transport system permease protein